MMNIERRGVTTGRWQNYALVLNGVVIGRVKRVTEGGGGIGIATRTAMFRASAGYWASSVNYATAAEAEAVLIARATK